MKYVKRIWSIFSLCWKAKKLYFVLNFIFSAISGLYPIVNLKLVNSLIESFFGSKENTVIVIILLLITNIGYSLISNIDEYVQNLYGTLISKKIKDNVIDKMKELPLSVFDNPDFMDTYFNATSQSIHMPAAFLRIISSTISLIISLSGYVSILLNLDYRALIILILSYIPYAIIETKLQKENVDIIFSDSTELRRSEYFSNTVMDIRTIKETMIFRLFDYWKGKKNQSIDIHISKLKKFGRKKVVQSMFGITLPEIAVASALLISLNSISNTNIYQFYMSVSGFLDSLKAVTMQFATDGSLLLLYAAYEDFMAYEDQIQPPMLMNTVSSQKITEPVRKIVFKDVSFSYSFTNKNAINNINLALCAGKKYLIVGENGAGKTTLIKLLCGLYQPNFGEIKYNSLDHKHLAKEELFEHISAIFQDYGKYSVSVKENISFCAESSIDEVIAAAVIGGADSFVKDYPEKYDTELSKLFKQNGIEPSTGQWQRLAISRAIYHQADILIFDEPCASLDPLAEHDFYKFITEKITDKIIVLVSHNLSSAKIVDSIIFMENGEITDSGNHEELMLRNKRYSEVYNIQAEKFNNAE